MCTAVLACVLAAIPLTAPYWVCVVGVVELWLVNGEPAAAAVFAAAAIAPSMFVDEQFYKQLK